MGTASLATPRGSRLEREVLFEIKGDVVKKVQQYRYTFIFRFREKFFNLRRGLQILKQIVSFKIESMVRPRASEQNVRIALAFADTVMMQTSPGTTTDANILPVARKGRQSIHAVFAACVPQLTRDSSEKCPKNRHGVAAMELNKALQAAGLRSVRKRNRAIDGSVQWRSKVRLETLELRDCNCVSFQEASCASRLL